MALICGSCHSGDNVSQMAHGPHCVACGLDVVEPTPAPKPAPAPRPPDPVLALAGAMTRLAESVDRLTESLNARTLVAS